MGECWNCSKIYPRNEIYCNTCIYPRGGKKHEKDSRLLLREKLSNNPTCTNLRSFKREGDNGESKPAEDD